MPLLFLLMGLWSPAAHADDVVRPADGVNELNLGQHVQILEDPAGHLTIKDVSGAFGSRFRPSDRENPSFGFTSSVIWLRFTLDLKDAEQRHWYLVERHPIIDHLYLYRPDGSGGFTVQHMGDELPFKARVFNDREFIFPLREDGGWPRTYYLRVSGKGALSLELKLDTAQGLVERTYQQQWMIGLFYGALIIMLIYNALLYFSVRHRAYLWYVVFLGSFILCFLNINGIGLEYLWPNTPRIDEFYTIFATSGMLGLVQYSRSFLDLGTRFPVYERIMRWLFYSCLAVLVGVLVIPAPWSYHLSTLLVVSEVSILTWIGWRSWRRGLRVARLYVVAWTVFMVSCLVFAADNLEIIPHTDISNYAPHIGSLWAVIFLSLALGDRIRLLEEERDTMARRARETLERHVREVERLDRDKLVFLEYLSHEMNTPLNWLSNAARLEQVTLPGELRESLEMVRKGQHRMMDLINTSLRYFDVAGRERSPSLSHCHPMWHLEGLVIQRDADLHRAGLKVINRIPPDLTVLACESELVEVLDMVLDNAIRFGGQGGDIVAEADVDTDEGSATLRISNPGEGIPPERLRHVFEPFFMVGSAHRVGGFGLSLAIAREMIEQMGGVIWAESDGAGGGVTIVIRLPLAAG